MRKAILSYVIKDRNGHQDKQLTLEEGSLFYVDKCISAFNDKKSLLMHQYYSKKIKSFLESNEEVNGELKLYYVRDALVKEELPFLFSDNKQIQIRNDFLKEQVPEVEKARKLLFQSRDQVFARMMLNDEKMRNSFNYRMKIDDLEFKKAKKYNIPVTTIDDENFIHFQDILKCRIYFQPLKDFRALVEDMLESWKNNLLDLPDEELYYYSRHLRCMLNEYDKLKTKEHKQVQHLSIRKKFIPVILKPWKVSFPKHVRLVEQRFPFVSLQKKIEEN